MQYKTISDEDLNKYMNQIYNIWFKRWKNNKSMNKDDWGQCLKEYFFFVNELKEYSIIEVLGKALMDELVFRDLKRMEK